MSSFFLYTDTGYISFVYRVEKKCLFYRALHNLSDLSMQPMPSQIRLYSFRLTFFIKKIYLLSSFQGFDSYNAKSPQCVVLACDAFDEINVFHNRRIRFPKNHHLHYQITIFTLRFFDKTSKSLSAFHQWSWVFFFNWRRIYSDLLT